ncbi:MAG: zinc ribbon domain-containing protein [Lachnospiraceae bacterium]|nr:zinc ribbon domain-containing protein [Lachnospiraceae bacterium]
MKCPYCGAPLNMEDKFCTYCGRPNTLAMQHQADMEHYEKEFAETQEEVLKKTRRAGSLVGFLVVLVILILLNIVAAFVNANAWNIRYERRKERALAAAAEHRANIERMLADQDYIGAGEYYHGNNLSGVEGFDEYSAIVSYAGQLSSLYYYLCDRDSNQLQHRVSEERIDATVREMASAISRICEDPKRNYYSDEAVTEEKLEVISGIQHQTEALLVAYAGFSADETPELRNMSKARLEEELREHLTAQAE